MTTKRNPATNLKHAKAVTDFGHLHYVPVLKPKAGELWALEQTTLAQQKCITPLFEIHRENGKTVTQHAAKVMANIKNAWEDRPIFLDTQLFELAGSADSNAASIIFQAASAENLAFVPATSLNRSQQYQAIIANHTQRGVMIRLGPADFYSLSSLQAQLAALLLQVGVSVSRADILLDYGAVANSATQIQAIQNHINSLPNLSGWRTVTVAGGAFPSSLVAQPAHQWLGVPRE